MKKSFYMGASLALLLVGGCTTTSPVDRHLAHQAEMQEQAQERMESRLDEAPEWFLNPPQATETGVYGVGSASGKNLQFTINKAKLQGEFNLAKMYGQAISGQERAYIADSGDGGSVRQDNSQVIDKLISKQDISGYEVISAKNQVIGSAYTSYVLLFLPYDGNNKMKEGRRIAAAQEEASKAYRGLEKRLERENLLRSAETQAEYNHELRLIAAEAELRKAAHPPQQSETEGK